MSKRSRNISLKVKFRVSRLPCAVCGIPYDIHCDHIVPFARGGSNDEGNIQPLCHQCNYAKKDQLTNEQLTRVVRARGLAHFMRGVYLWDTRFINHFDAPDMYRWRMASPDRVRHAKDLHAAFLSRVDA